MKAAPAIIALVVSSLLGSYSNAWAQYTTNGAFVCTVAGDQTQPALVFDGTGGIIITWQDNRTGATSSDIYAQSLNFAGIRQWTITGVDVAALTGSDIAPVIVSDNAGGAIIAWQNGVPSGMILASRLDPTGVSPWGGAVLVSSGFAMGELPAMIADGAGGAIIAWRDFRSGTNYDIYAQRVNASGTTLWTSGGVPVCNAANDQYSPGLISDGTGGAILVWTDERTGFDVYMERLNASGVAQWGTGTGVSLGATTNFQDAASIIADSAGGAIFSWETDQSQFDLVAQRVNASGVKQWGAGVPVCTAANAQLYPQMVSDGAAGAIITWQDSRSSNWDVYAQRLNASGVSQWASNGVDLSGGSALSPVIASNGAGGAMVVWEDSRAAPANRDIYSHAVTASGNAGFPTDGTAVCTALLDQTRPRVVNGAGSPEAFIAWQDRRGASWDIYALEIGLLTGVGDTPSPSALALAPNHPNPFLAGTTMNLDLPNPEDVKIEVFDVAGHRVRHSDLGPMSAGQREINFDGFDDRAHALPSGVYFYRVHAGSETVTKKMVIAR